MKALSQVASLLVMTASSQYAIAQEAGVQKEMQVTVQRNGPAVEISVRMPVTANARQVWQVLTDYDRMASFFPNLRSSKAISLSADRVRVEQTGVVTFGPLRFPFESVRDVELKPFKEIHSQAVGGTIKSGYAITRLREQGAVTYIEYKSESVPGVQIPFGLGMNAVEGRTREQFASLRDEIYRRAQSHPQSSGK